MNKLEMIRGAINFVVTLGVGNIVSDALKKIQPTQAEGVLRKFTTKVGGLAIGFYAADKVGDYVDKGWLKMTKQKEDSEIETKVTDKIIEDEA